MEDDKLEKETEATEETTPQEPVTPPVNEPTAPTVPPKKEAFPRGHALFGRKVLTTDAEEIDETNVIRELRRAYTMHLVNSAQMDYLYWYRRGRQPILEREKEIRPEITNKIVENHAEEIVTFKDGYLLGEPLQYVGYSKDQDITDKISELNRWMKEENKGSKDLELCEWFHTCGTSYRMVLPQRPDEQRTSPFSLYTLDPRYAFVVYYNGLGSRPMMGVKYVVKASGKRVFSVYTQKWYFEIENWQITKALPHILEDIPIIEYPANHSRIGAFEIVLPILDAMNNMESNRMDGIEQFIQSLMKFVNADISEDDFLRLAQLGAIKIKSDSGSQADVEYLTQELNQTQSQVTKEDLYKSMLYICGMPNRNGGSSTSDTGSAVIMRDGWSDAEARAKKEEAMFKQSETAMLRLALRYADINTGLGLRVTEVDTKFTRRNYENIQLKSQVLTTMLDNPKIHPKLAFIHCGMFIDPEEAYQMSLDYQKEQEAKAAKIAKAAVPGKEEEGGDEGGGSGAEGD